MQPSSQSAAPGQASRQALGPYLRITGRREQTGMGSSRLLPCQGISPKPETTSIQNRWLKNIPKAYPEPVRAWAVCDEQLGLISAMASRSCGTRCLQNDPDMLLLRGLPPPSPAGRQTREPPWDTSDEDDSYTALPHAEFGFLGFVFGTNLVQSGLAMLAPMEGLSECGARGWIVACRAPKGHWRTRDKSGD